MICTFIDTFCKYTTRVMRSLKRSSRCYWSAADCDGLATVVEVGWRCCCLEDCWECCSSLGLARWGMLFMKPESWSGWFPLKSSLTCSCRWLHCDLQNVPRELLEMYVLTGPRHLAEWLTELICVVSLIALRQTQMKTMLATIHVAIVGCHGNPVYRAVAWIPICISVAWSSKFLTCGRFPREAPTTAHAVAI
jgi:hypothetical protein